MATMKFSKSYYPEDPNNMSYDEIAYFLYGVDIDEKKEKKDE